MGAFSLWGVVLYSGFFPCIASALLVITPKFMREHAHKALEAIFFFDFFGRFYPIINFFLVTEFCILSYLIREAWTYTPPARQSDAERLSTMHPKSHQWRGQRNCYATAWAFTAWWYVSAV